MIQETQYNSLRTSEPEAVQIFDNHYVVDCRTTHDDRVLRFVTALRAAVSSLQATGIIPSGEYRISLGYDEYNVFAVNMIDGIARDRYRASQMKIRPIGAY